jgi:hypothetical protein
MAHIQDDCIRNDHVQQIFYNILQVMNMIAAQKLDCIEKIICGLPDRLAQQLLTSCSDQVRCIGNPFLYNKDHIVKNLHLLFTNIPEVTIDEYGSLKSWFR